MHTLLKLSPPSNLWLLFRAESFIILAGHAIDDVMAPESATTP
jgi:hypothetical protein